MKWYRLLATAFFCIGEIFSPLKRADIASIVGGNGKYSLNLVSQSGACTFRPLIGISGHVSRYVHASI